LLAGAHGARLLTLNNEGDPMRSMLSLSLTLSLLAAVAPVAMAGEEACNAETVARRDRDFGIDLYARLLEQEGNLSISPHSISSALAMTMAGARGRTEAQMRSTLGFALMSDLSPEKLGEAFGKIGKVEGKGCELSTANAMWAGQGLTLQPEYVSALRGSWGAEAESLDFARDPEAARRRINGWVEGKTHEKVKELIGPRVLSSNTRLVLTNAVYFQGRWATRFKKEQTAEAAFHLANGKESRVPLMHLSSKDTEDKVGYARTEEASVLELPYEGGELSFVAMMPNDPASFAAFEKSLGPEKVAALLGKIVRGPEVEVFLPRFEMTWAARIEKTLAAMGMEDLFVSGKADLSGISTAEGLFVSAVVHKTFVHVDEEGTEAAGATGVVMDKACAPAVAFRADRPFIFIIRDVKTGAVLFLGRCADPSVGGSM
jgi:serpin B